LVRHDILADKAKLLEIGNAPLSQRRGTIVVFASVAHTIFHAALQRPVGGRKRQEGEERLFLVLLGTLLEIVDEVVRVVLGREEARVVLIAPVSLSGVCQRLWLAETGS
jgi:hypothetical protein